MPRRAAVLLTVSRWSVPPQGASRGSCDEASRSAGPHVRALRTGPSRRSISPPSSAPSRSSRQRPSALEHAQVEHRGQGYREPAAVDHEVRTQGESRSERPTGHARPGRRRGSRWTASPASPPPLSAASAPLSNGTRRPMVPGSGPQAGPKRRAGCTTTTVTGPGSRAYERALRQRGELGHSGPERGRGQRTSPPTAAAAACPSAHRGAPPLRSHPGHSKPVDGVAREHSHASPPHAHTPARSPARADTRALTAAGAPAAARARCPPGPRSRLT